MGERQPKPTRRNIDASLLRVGYERLVADMSATLRRYSPEQIAASKTLSKRKAALAFYEQCLLDFDTRSANVYRKNKRKTYLIGVCCPACTYTVRVTRKWLDVAAIPCPNPECELRGVDMEELEVVKAKEENTAELAKHFDEMKEEFAQEPAPTADDDWMTPEQRAENDAWLRGVKK